MTRNNPTSRNYEAMNQAFDFFNSCLFDGSLPNCLITLQRKSSTLGYFAGERFGSAEGRGVTDEIALNPSHFKNRTLEQTLSTLVHEMAHLWQYHHGKISRAGYHDKQWAEKMQEIGLIPSSTGLPGGKATGQKMSHYIEPDCMFSIHCTNLLRSGFIVPYIELWDESKAKSKARSKTKFTCPECGANAWGKPELKIICADCDETMNGDEAI